MKPRITQNAVLIRLAFSKAGNSRKGDIDKVQTEADKTRCTFNKRLFDCPEYKAIGTFDGLLKGYVMARAIPCDAGFTGVALLPLALLPQVEEKLAGAEIDRAELVGKFLDTYDEQREKAKTAFADQYNAADYPDKTNVAQQFGLRWAYVTFETPENLPAGVAEREAKKLEAKFMEVEADVTGAMREAMAGLVSHLVETLTPREDGKKRKFYDSTVEKLAEFLTLFSARNVTNDTDLAALADKAKTMLGKVDPAALRENNTIRERIRAEAGELKAALDKLVETCPRRRFSLDE